VLINDLIRHRLKVNPLTLDGLKYLAKRVLLLGRLLKANTRQRALRRWWCQILSQDAQRR
jgi:maltose O-acetyltransferase